MKVEITLKELILEFCNEMNYDFDKLEYYNTQRGFILCYDDKYYQLNDDINGQILSFGREQKLKELGI